MVEDFARSADRKALGKSSSSEVQQIKGDVVVPRVANGRFQALPPVVAPSRLDL